MPSVHSFFAHFVEYDVVDPWDRERETHVTYAVVGFRNDGDGDERPYLLLSRESVEDDQGLRFVGPVSVGVEDGYGTDDGITAAVLRRTSLHVTLNETAAKRIEDDEIRVEFELDDDEYVRLRRELTALFAGLTAERVDVGDFLP
jgi:hypothetical protein